jgi:hypothetical protein
MSSHACHVAHSHPQAEVIPASSHPTASSFRVTPYPLGPLAFCVWGLFRRVQSVLVAGTLKGLEVEGNQPMKNYV